MYVFTLSLLVIWKFLEPLFFFPIFLFLEINMQLSIGSPGCYQIVDCILLITDIQGNASPALRNTAKSIVSVIV